MGLYILIVVLSFLAGLFFLNNDKLKMMKLMSLFFVFFAGFRFNVGVDYPNYVKIFEKEIGFSTREVGFQAFIDFLHYIGGTPQLMFLILAIIFQFFVFKIIEYYSTNYWLSLIILLLIPPFFLASFNGVRQYIAIVMFLYSLRFLDTKNYLKYFLTCIVGAIFFHQTIFFVMFLFPLVNRVLTTKVKILLFLGMIFINYSLELILSYTNYDRYLALENEVTVSSVTYILFLVSLLLIIFGNKINDFKNKILLLNLNYFSFLCLCIVLLQNHNAMIQMFMRLNNYFFFSFIVLVPNLISSFKDNSTKFVFSSSVVGLSLLYFFFTLISKGTEYNLTPYMFNFNLF